MMIVVGSFSGSPGVTTLALALAMSIEGGAVVDADWQGGRLAARFGLARDPGVLSLAADRAADVEAHVQRLEDGRLVLPGPESAEVAETTWRSAGPVLSRQLSMWSRRVVVDGGRLSPSSPVVQHLVPLADRVLVAVANDPAELAVASASLDRLRRDCADLALVLVGERPYSPHDVEGALRCTVAGTLPRDPEAAAAVGPAGTHRNLRATRWARAVRSIAEVVTIQSAGDPSLSSIHAGVKA